MKKYSFFNYVFYIILSANFSLASSFVNLEEKQESEERLKIFSSQLPAVQDYIKQLADQNIKPNLVLGVSSGEEGVERFDKSWLFLDISHTKSDSRHLTLSFNDKAELEALAQAFPHTFNCIAFDAEVPTYIKGFTLDHLKALHKALREDGEFYLPWQYCVNPEWMGPKYPQDQFHKHVQDFSTTHALSTRRDFLDPILSVPNALNEEEQDIINQLIVQEICTKNHAPLMEEVFGKGNLQILKEKHDRRLPFPENNGRLTNPPYVRVFKAQKNFLAKPIISKEKEKEELEQSPPFLSSSSVSQETPEDSILSWEAQLIHLKKKLPEPASLVIVVNEKPEYPARFDSRWVQLTNRSQKAWDPSILQSNLTLDELDTLAQKFPQAFDAIVFDVETPSLMIKDWTQKHFQKLSKLLQPKGRLILPIHFEWEIDHFKAPLDLSNTENNLLQKLKEIGTEKFFFKNISIPPIIQNEKIQKDIEAICSQVKMFAPGWAEEREKKLVLTSRGVNRVNISFPRIWLPNLKLDPELVERLNMDLKAFLARSESLEYVVSNYFSDLTFQEFTQEFTHQYLIPHTATFLEGVFGKNSVHYTLDKKMPFDVLAGRQHMNYVVFTCQKGS